MNSELLGSGYFSVFARIVLCLLYFYLVLLFFRNRAKMSSGGKGWSILTLGLFTDWIGEVLDLLEIIYPTPPDRLPSLKYAFFTIGAFLIVIGGIAWIKRIISTIERLNYETIIDPLTRAYNRRFLAENFEKRRDALLGNNAKDKQLAVAIVDIDDFKAVNDRYGHLLGDSVLKELTSALKANIRSGDHVIRYGGDEFIVIFVDAGPQDEHTILDRIYKSISSVVLPRGESLRASIGLAFCPQDGVSLNDLLTVADKRMYSSKSFTKRNNSGR